jgi:hypothetical protein
VPPNFITRRPMTTGAFPDKVINVTARKAKACGPKGAYT